MRVLDPQSALLTTSEVHDFLAHKPPRFPLRRIGSYAPVNLKGYQRIREDFQEYISSTAPHIASYPPPETFIKNVVPRLRSFGLAKTEVFGMVNLGIGLSKEKQPQQTSDGSQDTNGDAVNGEEDEAPNDEPEEPAEEVEASADNSDMELLARVVDELYERFPGDEGQDQIRKILDTMQEEYERAHSMHASTNGDAKLAEELIGVSLMDES